MEWLWTRILKWPYSSSMFVNHKLKMWLTPIIVYFQAFFSTKWWCILFGNFQLINRRKWQCDILYKEEVCHEINIFSTRITHFNAIYPPYSFTSWALLWIMGAMSNITENRHKSSFYKSITITLWKHSCYRSSVTTL